MLKARVIPVTPLQQNCSLIWCNETMEGAFVDPGGDADQLLEAVEKFGVDVKQILLTHGHLDHAGAAKDVREALDVPIIGPQLEDDFWLQQIEESARQYGIPGLKNVTPTKWLEDGDVVKVGNEELLALHCPGHTPGHLVFVNKAHKVAFVGDVLFQGSIGRTDFPRGNHQQLIDSITDKLWPLGDDITFVPGHGPLSTFGAERKSNPFVGDAALGRK